MIREELIVKSNVLARASSATSEPTMRTWKDTTGKFSISAILLQRTSDTVTLQTEAGKRVTLPIAKLSRDDQKHLKQHAMSSDIPFE